MSDTTSAASHERDGDVVQITKESAKEVVGWVFDELKTAAATQKFFPDGIQLIHVELDVVGAIKVVVKISGSKAG